MCCVDRLTTRVSLDTPGVCFPTETDTHSGWTERIKSKLTTTRNRTISFNCQGELTSNRRQCLAVETRTDVAKDKKAETYLDGETKNVNNHDFEIPILMKNEEWNIGLKCSGKREWLPGKCSVVVAGESVMLEAAMDKIDTLTREMSKVPHAVFLPTKTEPYMMPARHPLSPALVRTGHIAY